MHACHASSASLSAVGMKSLDSIFWERITLITSAKKSMLVTFMDLSIGIDDTILCLDNFRPHAHPHLTIFSILIRNRNFGKCSEANLITVK